MKITSPGKYEQGNGRVAEVVEVNERFAIGWDSDREGAIWYANGGRRAGIVGEKGAAWNIIGPEPVKPRRMVRYLVWDLSATSFLQGVGDMPGRAIGTFYQLGVALGETAGKPHLSVIRLELDEQGAFAELYKVPG